MVSILAHPEGRALHRLMGIDLGNEDVSILAHPEGRALPGLDRNISSIKSVSILAHPEGRALRFYSVTNAKVDRFQSSPIPKDGRYAEQPLSR